jgi:tetratricopeptide (TPR) repeat protein
MKSYPYKLGLVLATLFAMFSLGFFGTIKAAYYLDQADREYEAKNYYDAFEAYEDAAKSGSPEAYYRLYGMSLEGLGTRTDEQQALYFLDKAVELKYPAAYVSKGILLLYANNGQEEQGLRLLKEAASMETPLAYYHLAMLYFHGIVIPKDMAKAQEYKRLAQAYGIKIDFETISQTIKTEPSAPPMDTMALTKALQKNLKTLGFFPGKVDGISGPMTKRAIEQFQDIHGFAINGMINQETLKQTQSILK